MWPWSKRKDTRRTNHESKENQLLAASCGEISSPKPSTLAPLSAAEVMSALASTERSGPTISLAYAQMNGYDEKLVNPMRLTEIVELTQKNPSFTETGIDLALECRLGDLEYASSHPPRRELSFTNGEINETVDKEKLAAHTTLAQVLRQGDGDIGIGLAKSGINYKEYIMDLAVAKRNRDLQKLVDTLTSKEAILKPLFIRAHAQGRNKYGEISLEPLVEEVSDFFSHFLPRDEAEFFHLHPPLAAAMRVALAWIEEAKPSSSAPEDGHDFEHWCAAEVEKQGWITTVSKATGDQGVDVLAHRENKIVAIQCKRYNSPIGNKAVQEAYAGMQHYRASIAVIIGTGGYTKSAIQLSKSTGVILMDATEVLNFTNRIEAAISGDIGSHH